MRNARLDELQAGSRNNHLRYVDDTTLMAESEEELYSLLTRVKEESGLKLYIKKKLRLWHLATLMLSLQSCLILCDPIDCRPPSFSVHGTVQARILEWVAMPS